MQGKESQFLDNTSYHSLINRLLMVHGSWLKVQGSCLKARGSRLLAKRNLARGPGSWGPRAKFILAMSHEPWATSLEA